MSRLQNDNNTINSSSTTNDTQNSDSMNKAIDNSNNTDLETITNEPNINKQR